MELWGLDCPNPACVHDTMRGYRLFFRVKPIGAPPGVEPAVWQHHLDTLATSADWQRSGGSGQKPAGFISERPPVVFRGDQLPSAYAQIEALGGRRILGAQIVEKHHSLPPGFDARLLCLLPTPLPRIALYFRWRPDLGERLLPDRVFQCLFPPNATAADRRTAPERQLTEEEFTTVVRRPTETGPIAPQSLIKCQHCHQPIPLKAFTMHTLREVEKGD